jgi:hypothetical protein
MRAVIHVNHAEHQKQHAAWMADGLRRHDVEVSFAPFDSPQAADVVVVWGWRQQQVVRAAREAGRPILVMERGHLGNRTEWTSCGWDGLQNRAIYPAPSDGGVRFIRHFGGMLKSMEPGKDNILLCGQVEGDAALGDLNFKAWAQGVTDALIKRGHEVRYRPHPNAVRQSDTWCPAHAHMTTTRSLEADLRGARAVVIFNSTSGVEAAMAGYPVVALDEGAMAWPIASHRVNLPFYWPSTQERARWASRLAWTQWRPEEISAGDAWSALYEVMPTV